MSSARAIDIKSKLQKCPRCKQGLFHYDPPRWAGDTASYRCPLCGHRTFSALAATSAIQETFENPITQYLEIIQGSDELFRKMENISTQREQRLKVVAFLKSNLDLINSKIVNYETWVQLAAWISETLSVPLTCDALREIYTQSITKSKQKLPSQQKHLCSCGKEITGRSSKATRCQTCQKQHESQSRKVRLLASRQATN